MKILITGPDACGKDTQIEKLKKQLEDLGYRTAVISIWNAQKTLIPSMEAREKMQVLESLLKDLPIEARSYFLMSLWKTAEKVAIDQRPEVYLINGGYQKYWASELAHGDHSASWSSAEDHFLSPDYIFYLKADVPTCLSRKERMSLYESGFHSGGRSSDSVRAFQERLHRALDRVLSQAPHEKIDASRSADRVFEEIWTFLKTSFPQKNLPIDLSL